MTLVCCVVAKPAAGPSHRTGNMVGLSLDDRPGLPAIVHSARKQFEALATRAKSTTTTLLQAPGTASTQAKSER